MKFQAWSRNNTNTVTAALRQTVSDFADNIFLDFLGEKITYAEFDRLSTSLAHGLSERGVVQGDRVGSILDTAIESVVVWLAINKIGAIHVPVNTAYKGEFLRHQFANTNCRVIIAESDYSKRFIDIEEGLTDCELLLTTGEERPEFARIKTESLADAYSSCHEELEDRNTPEDLCMLIFTGGTTGPSKACMISHSYACNLASQILDREGRNEKDVNWTPLPLFHMNATAGSILSCMMVGASVALFPRFSVSNFWHDVERSGATVVNLLGSMLNFIANAKENEASKRYFGKLKAIRGSPFPPELQEVWKKRFGVKYAGSNGYGITEAARVTSLPDAEYAPPGSSGRANEDFDVRIFDEDDNQLPPETAGEIVVRPKKPGVMFDGYWNLPSETLKIMKNMWLHTGDIGKFDKEGFFYFVDRKKDYLRRRGENISSFEMETTLKSHPCIEEVAVHAVLANESEDEVKVTATLKEGSKITEEELCQWCVDRMPYFAVPRYIEFRAKLPKNPVGRTLKYQLREEGCTPDTWDRELTDFELPKR